LRLQGSPVQALTQRNGFAVVLELLIVTEGVSGTLSASPG
jgi:hypothetical protein